MIYKISLYVFVPLYLILSVLDGIIAPMSVMAFDAPHSESHWEPWVFVLSIFGLGVCFLIGSILMIIFALQKRRRALIISLLLPLPFLLILLTFFFIPTNF